MEKDLAVLQIKDNLIFEESNPVQSLKLVNQSKYNIVFKIKTNDSTAISLEVSHGFVMAQSQFLISVKMAKLKEGVKLQINYTLATQEMISTNNSKMTNIDKNSTNKSIVLCEVSGHIAKVDQKKQRQSYQAVVTPPNTQQSTLKTQYIQLEQSYSEPKQTSEIKQISQVKGPIEIKQETMNRSATQNTFLRVQTQQLSVAEQPDSQEEDQITEELNRETQTLQKLIKQLKDHKQTKTIFNKWIIYGGMALFIMLGSMLKQFMVKTFKH